MQRWSLRHQAARLVFPPVRGAADTGACNARAGLTTTMKVEFNVMADSRVTGLRAFAEATDRTVSRTVDMVAHLSVSAVSIGSRPRA